MCSECDFTNSEAQNISAASAGAGTDGDCVTAIVENSYFQETMKSRKYGITSLVLVEFQDTHANVRVCL